MNNFITIKTMVVCTTTIMENGTVQNCCRQHCPVLNILTFDIEALHLWSCQLGWEINWKLLLLLHKHRLGNYPFI